MRATWYVLEDGTAADPSLIAPDAAGVLRHEDGRAVAMGLYGPRSRSVDLATVAQQAPPESDRQMKPAAGARYKTR